MKRRIVAALICTMMALVACGNKGGETTNDSISQVEEETGDSTEEKCYITIVDGEDSYEIQVSAYGDEVELPEPKGSSKGGEFVCWLSQSGVFNPKDKAVSEEFMSFDAVYTSPTEGLIVIVDDRGNGYSTSMSEEEEFVIENPYIYDYYYNDNDYYIDYYVDEDGNRYDFDEKVKIGHGEYLLLKTFYSEDLSGAYKVSLSYNPPLENSFDESSYKYVKKGETIPVESMMEYDGFTIDGWYDAPEGGNLICEDGANYTPNSDMDLFAHWNEN